MQGPDFLYFLTDENTRFYSVDQFENVVISTTPKPLTFSPDGWTEISIHTERNKKYFGLERSFTIPLNFVEDGAKIIKHQYYNGGVEAKLFLLILQQKLFIDPTQYGFYYDTLYKGEIDLSTFNHQQAKVTVNAIEGGLAKLIKANENTIYEIDVDVEEAVNVEHDGLNIKETSNYGILDLPLQSILGGINYSVGVFRANKEGSSTGVQTGDSPQQNLAGFDLTTNDDRWILKSLDQSTTFHLKGTFGFTLAGTTSSTRLYFQKSDGTIYDVFPTADRANGHYSTTVDLSIPMVPGERLFMFGAIGSATLIKYDPTTFTIDYFTRFRTTYVKWLRPLYILQQIIKKMTDSKYQASGGLLTLFKDIVMTCGDAVRGFAGSKLKISLSKFFNSYNVPLCAGMGILNGQLVLEALEYWIEPVTTIDLGEVSDLKITPYTEGFYNTIKIGSPNQTYDDVNGRDEFNNTHLYTTPITRVSKELTLVSDAVWSMYTIEFARINLEGKKTTDSGADNQLFMAMLNPTVLVHSDGNPADDYYYQQFDRSLNAGATGLIDAPSAYNIGLSPKRCLLRWGWFIRSFLDKLDGGTLKFQTTEKNAELIANGITEKADVPVGSLADKKFLPVLFEFETKVPDNLNDILTANPIVSYMFTYQGIQLSGISMKSGIEPSSNKTQVYQLLADANNNLQDLISIYE